MKAVNSSKLGLGLLVAMAGGCLISETALAQSTPTFTNLYSFGPNSPDGAQPYSPLIFDSSGALIGTTSSGGAGNCGTVFKLTPPLSTGGSWSETLLHSFDASGSGGCGMPYSGGVAGVIADASGALYGTTQYGGGAGKGTVFMLTPSSTAGAWSETVLHSFSGTDGANPVGGLMFDLSGALNGTASAAGTSPSGVSGVGTVFQMSPPFGQSSAFATTHFFTSSPGGDGFQPQSGLIADASGALYGTTSGGGQSGGGTVFQLTPGTWTETLLYSFTYGLDGGAPYNGNLLKPFGASGVIYGTTLAGGLGYGTVFQLTPPSVTGAGWTEIPIWSFTGGSDGGYPMGGLIADTSGALYGTTSNGGGPANVGVIYKLTPPSTAGGPWTQTVLYTFTNGSDGGAPSAGLIADASGALYGTTPYGGNGSGSVFKLTIPANFYGAPGSSNCVGQSVSTLSNKYGTMLAAAKALGYPNVKALHAAVASYCGG